MEVQTLSGQLTTGEILVTALEQWVAALEQKQEAQRNDTVALQLYLGEYLRPLPPKQVLAPGP